LRIGCLDARLAHDVGGCAGDGTIEARHSPEHYSNGLRIAEISAKSDTLLSTVLLDKRSTRNVVNPDQDQFSGPDRQLSSTASPQTSIHCNLALIYRGGLYATRLYYDLRATCRLLSGKVNASALLEVTSCEDSASAISCPAPALTDTWALSLTWGPYLSDQRGDRALNMDH
jgi:hypothetical protein